MDAQQQITSAQRKIVCTVCGRGPLNEDGAVSLFTPAPKVGEPRRRYCAEHLPLDEARRRLGRGLRDPDDAAAFRRRVESGR